MNIVVLTGRLTADPELKQTQKGTPVTDICLAVDRETSEDEADFPTVIAWRKTAEFVCKYLHKGSRVVVTGALRTRNYQDSYGNNRKVTEVEANRIEFADVKPKGPFDERG